MKDGPKIPNWAAGVGIAALVLVLLIVGSKFAMSGGPLPESQYPKEAFQRPAYDPSKYGAYTKDGKPVGGPDGAPPAAPSGGAAGGSNPYSGAYGQRP